MAEKDPYAQPISKDEQAEIDRVVADHHGDGPGDLDDLPKSDFVSFAGDDVLKEDDK